MFLLTFALKMRKVMFWSPCIYLFIYYLFIYYLRIENAEGSVLIAVYLFIYLFVWVLFA